jgi:site-specific DNA-methyltransferase (adenine-specific)
LAVIQVLDADNLTAMAMLAHAASPPRFALAYLDPPFFTQKTYRMDSGEVAFEDRWESMDAWVTRLQRVAEAAFGLLVPEGSLVVHLDSKTSHYAKVALDQVLGRKRFASEIVWRYRRWPTRTRNFQRVHDVLLRWVKDPSVEPRFTQLYEPLSPKTVEQWGQRKQRAVMADGTKGKAVRVKSSKSDEASPGAPLGDVWELGIVAPMAKERTGYPTQKPEKLLERLVEATTVPGDAVLDPYVGSGTTLAVCARLGRDAVGIDISSAAIRVTRERLALGRNLAPMEARP